MKEPTVRVQKIKKDTIRTRLILFGALALALLLCSVFCEHLTPYDPYVQDLKNAKAPPSPEHIFGTDRYGRDMLSRVIVGSRTSIFSTLLLVGIVTALGTMVGVFCGWHGKWIDTVLMRISDMFLAFPGLVFAMAVALVQQFCNRVLVLYKGKIVEQGRPDDVIRNPQDAYTKRLIDSIL